MIIVAPSILSMDYSDTKKQLDELKVSGAKWLHFDVMDGHFTNNFTFGVDVLKGLKKGSNLEMDVHVMIEEPHKFADTFIDAGAHVYTFHYEVMKSKEEIIELAKHIRSKGCKAGLSIKPKTDVSVLEDLIEYFDLILIMSVEPGFGGQSFDSNSLEKIKCTKEMINSRSLNCHIQVDGGINLDTSKLVKEAGADVLVAGSYVFKNNICEAVQSLL